MVEVLIVSLKAFLQTVRSNDFLKRKTDRISVTRSQREETSFWSWLKKNKSKDLVMVWTRRLQIQDFVKRLSFGSGSVFGKFQNFFFIKDILRFLQ